MGLYEAFHRSADARTDAVALVVDDESLSYGQLRARALSVASSLGTAAPDERFAAVLASRSVGCFAGILGVLASGRGYVPMLPSLPPARIAGMIERSGARFVVVDAAGNETLEAVRPLLSCPITAVVADACSGELSSPPGLDAAPDDLAYLLFTSGSTGTPKGVMVTQANIDRFLDVVIDRYGLASSDRFTHLFETTFDLSLFDLFAAWRVGGCVCVPDSRERMLPHKFIERCDISVWFSVPSAALLMKRMRLLEPGALPSLRLALFCGEALPVGVALAFAKAAPNATVENIYGPTELTLACTHYTIGPETAQQAENDVVPIGDPFAGMRAKVVDASLVEVEPGEVGELLMAGPQCAPGYWSDPEKTAQAFLVPPGETEVFYRTGDRVRRPSPGQPMTFLGRVDSQTKINGHRVELGEIEAVLMREGPVDIAVALGWPKTPAGASGVVAFVVEGGLPPGYDDNALLDRAAMTLPNYMVPKRIVVLDEWPLNANDKIDRKALLASLEAEDGAG